MASKSRLRFAFTIAEGPNAGLTSGPRRAWADGEDFYVIPAKPNDVWKASLHADAAWQLAMTREHVASGELPTLPEGLPRNAWKFKPAEFVDGGRLAFAVAVARSAMLPGELRTGDLHIAVEDRWDKITVGYFWMTEPGVDLAGVERLVGESIVLRSGRRVWLAAGTESVKGEPEPMADGAVVVPMTPEADDVSAPGLMVKGLGLDYGEQ